VTARVPAPAFAWRTGPLLALALVLALVPWHAVPAAEPLVSFETDAQRERYDRLLEEYRCLKCQNQDLAGSNAALAGDLRREIRTRIIEGADDQVIDEYLVARYGDFVRYKPRFGGINLVLWLGPFVLLAIGLGAGWTMARRGRREEGAGHPAAAREVDESALNEARRLLDGR